MADDQQPAGTQQAVDYVDDGLLSLVASAERELAAARSAGEARACPPSNQAEGEVSPPQDAAPRIVYRDLDGRSRPMTRHVKFPRRDGASDSAGYRARLRRQAAEAEASAPLSSSRGRQRPPASPAIPPPATPKHERFGASFDSGESRDG